MNETHRLEGFNAILADHQNSTHFYEEINGALRRWGELSTESKLDYVARDAALSDVAFDRFAQAARDAVGQQGIPADGQAYLRLLFRNAREFRKTLAYDAVEGMLTGLEAFGDEFDRLAITAEQKKLADAFREYVGVVTAPFSDLARPVSYQQMLDDQTKNIPPQNPGQEIDRGIDR